MHICTGYLPTICFYKYLCKYADVFNFFFSKWLTHFYEKAQSHAHEYTEYNIYLHPTDVSFALGKYVHTLLNGLEN